MIKYSHGNRIYAAAEICAVLPFIEPEFVGNNKGIYYADAAAAFDIETTSFYRSFTDGGIYPINTAVNTENYEKLGCMYVWQLGFNGFVIIGRKWSEFTDVLNIISKWLKLSDARRLVIFVHNLSFEFQFVRKWLQWYDVFSIEERRPLYAVTDSGIEFRCSYLLAGANLETVAKNLTKYKIKKLVGTLDYTKLRHTETPLTDAELQYIVNDVKIVMQYILEQLEIYKHIVRLPLTNTGRVRQFCRKNTLNVNGKKNYRYSELISGLTIDGTREFAMLHRAFCGGYVHSNSLYSGVIMDNVASYDITSSYPSVMVSEYYPMTHGVFIDVENDTDFQTLTNNYLCVFDIELTNLQCVMNESFISVTKCFKKVDAVVDNGRISAAKCIALTITNIDWNIIKVAYRFTEYRIGFLYAYKAAYLPTELVNCILQLYGKKTELKDDETRRAEYLNAKSMLNAVYGMCVTSPLKDAVIYDSEIWITEKLNENERELTLHNYNVSENRFLSYAWGVFVTAYARRNLWTAIYNIGDDYIYSDTDSVKFANFEGHKAYFEYYNTVLKRRLKNALNYHNLPFELCTPKTRDGKEKMLGAWEFEGVSEYFKTIGAKRYMQEKDGIFGVTVSGLDKNKAMPYLLEKYGKNGVFDAFTDNLTIPPDGTGKNLICYVDYETSGDFFDYTGTPGHFDEKSSVALTPCEFTLNLSSQYLEYLYGKKQPQFWY